MRRSDERPVEKNPESTFVQGENVQSMNPTSNPARFLSWREVLRTLDIDPPESALPVIVKCPLCHEDELKICPDELLSGQWLYCSGCRFSGDLIEVCVKCWSVTPSIALRRLAIRGVRVPERIMQPAALESYLRDHIHYQERVNRFWEGARKRRCEEYSDSLCRLDQTIGIYPSHRAEGLLTLSSRFVGAATVQQVEDMFHPGSNAARPRLNRNGRRSERRGSGAGGRRLFKGEGWDELLVLAFFDLPGRICGFLFIGRNADPGSGDFIYKSINRGASNKPIKEAGVAMLEAMPETPHRIFGDVAFLLSDPLTALRLQARSLQSEQRLLPVAVIWSDARHRTKLSKNLLGGRRPIVWAPRSDDQLLVDVSRVDGLVSIGDPLEDQGWGAGNPLWWLRCVKEVAVPWGTMARDAIRQRPLESVRELLLRFRHEPKTLQRLLDEPVAPEKLEPLRQELAFRPSVSIRGHRISETADGWRSETSGALICNGNVRVDELLHLKSGQRLLRGSVQLGDQKTPFLISERDAIRRGLFACIKNVAEQFEFQPRWSRGSDFVAERLHEPKARGDVDVVGWHDCRFWFSQFSLKLGGSIDEETVLVTKPPAPGSTFSPPGTLTKYEIELLCTRGREARIFWAVAACVAFNVLAPLLRYKPQVIGFIGAGAQRVGLEAAGLLGCVEAPAPTSCRHPWAASRLDEVCDRHNWPVVLLPPSGRAATAVAKWAASDGPKNCVFPVYTERAAEHGRANGWHLVHSEPDFGTLECLARVGSKVLPHYLRSVCQRHGATYFDRQSWLLSVLHDLAWWLESIGGDQQVVLRAQHLLRAPDLTDPGALVPFPRP